MKIEKLLTAGEFAKMTGVTKHTLFHYDKIGLFSPEIKGKNGYRYYTLEQLDVFDVIITLKELDMPLAEIKVYMENRTPRSLERLLDKELEIISARIERLKRASEWTRRKRRQIREAGMTDYSSVGISEVPELYLIARELYEEDDKTWAMAVGDLLYECNTAGIRSVYGVGYKQKLDLLQRGIYDAYFAAYVLLEKKPPRGWKYEVRPGGCYLTAYHRGHWKEIGEAYERMFAYAGEYGLQLEGESYEDSILDGLTQEREEEYVTRISCRCSKIQG